MSSDCVGANEHGATEEWKGRTDVDVLVGELREPTPWKPLVHGVFRGPQ